MSSNTAERRSRKQMEAVLINKAWKDEAFRQELIADPAAVIQRELDLTVPAGVAITVVQESPSTLCLVIPANPFADEGRELSDDELAVVAGGTSGGKATGRLDPRGLDLAARVEIAADLFPMP